MVYCCIGHHLNNDGALWCAVCGSLVEGAMVSDYRLLSYVGNGSAADVYLAEQPALNKRKVVIKILHHSWSEARVSGFEREAAALALLSHPYILPIFDYGVLYRRATGAQQSEIEEPLPYLVLPYAEQGSLAEIMDKQGKRPWSLTRVVTIAKEMAEALDYAHARGVLHRDIKPANILQMGSHAVLSDFSVAASIDADISHLSTPWAGSPGYMAPEVWQLHPGRYSDQYALAVTCYYLLAAQLPWQRGGSGRSQSWAELHCFVMPRSILELRPRLPLAVDGVLKRALSKGPHDRYVTVQAFADDLYVASQDITQEIGSLPMPTGQRSRKVVVRPTLVGTPPHSEEEHKEQQPVFVGPRDGAALQTATTAPGVQHKLSVTPAPDAARRGHSRDASTDKMKVFINNDTWVWSALVLNLLICLVVAAEYALQVGNATVAANRLLVVWPGLLTGPLLALLFRRVSYSTPLWSLFWGVFFGLTDALVSIALCLIWAALASLPGQYHCPHWCASGDGAWILIDTVGQFAAQAVVPVVLSLWIAVIGGAIIGVMRVRST
jgi:serine/threonine protein kinase